MTAPGEVSLGCYVYGITSADLAVPAELRGVGDQAVDLFPLGELAAVVSPVDPDWTRAGRADLLAHGRVLDTIAELGPVVPVRFGSVLRDHDAVAGELLEPGQERFATMLQELAGRAQFTVRARYEEQQVLTEIVAENPAIAQLRKLTRDRPGDSSYGERVRLGELVAAALEAKIATDSDVMLAELEPHVVGINIRESVGIDRLLDVAVLVEDQHRAEFEQAVEDLAAAFAGRARLKLIGPTAAYDFVSAEESWA
ncbi:GvpL/GvpF family gas vesicle protein [Kribbella jejuensis]|uniref:GvpL/GvpF family gas vesicle protein n=1 Tax=Kribbella jejuensis TaxID=236068 RepID=UPI00163AE5E7|nr:GvpL/GvpF family gas vesicle protein [Kribbella jejuensis]